MPYGHGNVPTAGGADALTDRAMVVLLERPVVSLSADLVEMLAECERSGRALQIVTPPGSRVTQPVRAAANGTRAHWIVADDEDYYEGTSGRPMRWDGGAFSLVPDATDYAPGFVARPRAPAGVHLSMTFQARHTPDAVLGRQAAELLHLLTGRTLIGWGPSEPLEHPWDPRTLTSFVHNKIQRHGLERLIAIGAGERPAIATLEFFPLAPPAKGIAEVTVLTVGYTPDDPPPVSHIPWLTDMLTTEHPVTALLAQLSPGPADLTSEPRWTGASAPIGMAAAGSYDGPPGFTRQRLGPDHAPVTWFHLGDGESPEYWKRHQTLLHHLRTT
ncbi:MULTISPECIES: DUF6177 family protein [Actinomadura]|uniref:DUF6177 family protein n=1 Tax=Actinomadura yumaensis TaxID=111807 RepID=A0ABW2CM56_9ACTN|nr:DUF6177 family protein [Actinomadura sp. J1-007]MWK34233.1 hypothetical protein [Actinomadura sp. J1-007]